MVNLPPVRVFVEDPSQEQGHRLRLSRNSYEAGCIAANLRHFEPTIEMDYSVAKQNIIGEEEKIFNIIGLLQNYCISIAI